MNKSQIKSIENALKIIRIMKPGNLSGKILFFMSKEKGGQFTIKELSIIFRVAQSNASNAVKALFVNNLVARSKDGKYTSNSFTVKDITETLKKLPDAK